MYANSMTGSMLTGVIPPPWGKSTTFIKDKTKETAKHIAANDSERTSKRGFAFSETGVSPLFLLINTTQTVITLAKATTTHKINNQFSAMSSHRAGLLPLKKMSNIFPINNFISLITNLSNELFAAQQCVKKKSGDTCKDNSRKNIS